MNTAKEIKTVSILGCGWLGLAIGSALVEKGFRVKGSKTSRKDFSLLEVNGIKPYEIRLLPAPKGDNFKEFLDSDLLIIAIPPNTNTEVMESYHATQIDHVKDEVEDLPIDKVIYISSTGVYPENNKEVNENSDVDMQTKRSKVILLAESVLRRKTQLDATILRCGGLMGYDRIPGKYFAGQKDLTTGQIPVNYVHRDDVVGVVLQVIEANAWNMVFNVVAPGHPTRKEIYLANAAQYSFEAPTFKDGDTPKFKVVSSKKLIEKIGYTFKYPDPLQFPYEK